MRVLHIIATPRGDESRTLKVSRIFFDSLIKKHPDCYVDELNVSTENLPTLTVKIVYGKYVLLSGRELADKLKETWRDVERHIERFMAADLYVISTPMWNFNIPYTLKQYIDIIIQPKYLFRYTKEGLEGLVKNKKMVVIASRGGDYRPGSPTHSYDLQEPYLRAIFGFVGLTDITFIKAEAMDMGPDRQKNGLEGAIYRAREAAEGL